MPRDCIILGSGRSGTSLATGLLAGNSYFMGDELWTANIGNPTGYFEDREVNEINDYLLAPYAPSETQSGLLGRLRSNGYPLGHLQRWLSVIPPGTPMICPAPLRRRMKALTARRPFCLKDPRFCYTLRLWRPHLGGAAILCVFRDPAVTAASIMTEDARAEYLKNVRMDIGRAFAVWEMMYRNVLEIHYPPVATGYLCITITCLMAPRTSQLKGYSAQRSTVHSPPPISAVPCRPPESRAARAKSIAASAASRITRALTENRPHLLKRQSRVKRKASA